MPRWSLTRTFILITLGTLLLCAECRTSPPGPYKYHFLQQVDLAPYKKTYQTGDTIRFGFTDTGKMAFDTVTNSLVRADSLTFVVDVAISRVDTFHWLRVHPVYFLTSIDGSGFSQAATNQEYGVTTFNTRVAACEGGPDLRFWVEMIPQHAGVYELDVYLYVQSMTNCYNGAYVHADMSFVFNLQDCNGDLLNGLNSSYIASGDPSYATLALQKKTFFFKVE